MSDTSLHRARSLSHASGRPSLLGWIIAATDSWRSRRALETLEPHMLDDIGISAKAAAKEARRGIWDVPAHWID